MSTASGTKRQRIDLRLHRNAKELLERAASFEGKTVSGFVLTSALAKAEQTIYRHEMIALNARESEAFFSLLSEPVRFNESMTAALKAHDRSVILR